MKVNPQKMGAEEYQCYFCDTEIKSTEVDSCGLYLGLEGYTNVRQNRYIESYQENLIADDIKGNKY